MVHINEIRKLNQQIQELKNNATDTVNEDKRKQLE
jgi:hypothetical protein